MVNKKIASEALDEEFTKFLNGMKHSSAMTYGSYLRHWINYSHMNGKETLAFKKADTDAKTEKLVVGFKAYLIQIGKSELYAKCGTASLRAFYNTNRLPLSFIPKEKRALGEGQRATRDYLFTPNDLRAMYEQGSLTDRYVLTVGVSVGLRASDFITFTYGDFRSLDLDSEAPVFLGERPTQREHVSCFPFLNSDALPIIKALLVQNKEKKDSDRVLPWNPESLAQCIQIMFKKAHLVSGGKFVKFHCLRKYLITKLSSVASESQWKQVVGKRIPEIAYVGQDELREVYKRAMPTICFTNGNGNGKNAIKIEQLEDALVQSQKQVAALEQTLRLLREEIASTNAENTAKFDMIFANMSTENFRQRREKARERAKK